MQILTADIGTGTQDILLFDSERAPENCLKLVMPSPTLMLARVVRKATANYRPLVITGSLMGGGPITWAVEEHRRAGLRVFATPGAARTFDDDLERVEQDLGIILISEEEARELASRDAYDHILFRDFSFVPIRTAFMMFGLDLRPDALALAVFDHGAAPPKISDRQFRMDYLCERLRQDARLSAFAFRGEDAPPIMTRLRALAETAMAQSGLPVIVMDTAPAAVLGALDDPNVAGQPHPVVVNVGNFHTLAFQFRDGRLLRLLEHHTGELSPERLVAWLRSLAEGSIRHDAVFGDKGHGVASLDDAPLPLDFLVAVGPRRAMLADVGLPVYFAVPHGDQMLAGCYGLLRACADIVPAWREAITDALAGRSDRSLW